MNWYLVGWLLIFASLVFQPITLTVAQAQSPIGWKDVSILDGQGEVRFVEGYPILVYPNGAYRVRYTINGVMKERTYYYWEKITVIEDDFVLISGVTEPIIMVKKGKDRVFLRYRYPEWWQRWEGLGEPPQWPVAVQGQEGVLASCPLFFERHENKTGKFFLVDF